MGKQGHNAARNLNEISFSEQVLLLLYSMAPVSPEPSVVPGDIFVRPVDSGFLVGRVVRKIGLGPWWSYITVVVEFDEAVEQARARALADGVRAWLQKRGDEYDPL